ncbi:coiled-coil domain-containing protein 136 isoform X1 [Xenopus tropicalis]|uniref:Coiled-coil domain-containing protein 136 isoform X1 n=1 Tax=Xenopus tropicalis TaxID=8364 RepID=A0A8J1JA86_XENTR|nr:coiled-coil domain-containing protein 136 isoform X1 [Xenopus tropicalis]XP_031753566.1 coiled-coil domain-containing protein 136 isoform X1 [Xenopus tropicalis]|eukprot:XP_012814122.1 PREDICTED: coiled-coil domain-containing protein 136 isoform X3 [Xenopus tropicalis]
MEDVDGQGAGRAQQMAGSSPVSGGTSRWIPQQITGRSHSYARELLNGEYSEDEDPPDLESESGDVPSGSEAGSGSIILESRDLRSQIIQLLTELEETRELALKHEDSFLEMQGILEEERLASAQQAEIFTKQIQRLQAQLRSVQEEVDSLEQEKECELLEVSQELRCAQEEIMSLRHSAEEAAAERESDIASLQEELCRLRAELHELQETRQEYEMEITTLRAEINMKSCTGHVVQPSGTLHGELQFLRDQCQHLQMERSILQESNSKLKSHLLLLGEEVTRDVDIDSEQVVNNLTQEHEKDIEELTENKIPQYDQVESIPLPCIVEEEEGLASEENIQRQKLTKEEERQKLHSQLLSAEEKVQLAQSECEGLLSEIEELQMRHRLSQEEQDKLQEELRLCREEIHRLKDSGLQAPCGSDPPVLSLPLLGLIIVVGMLWCWWAETS